MPKNRNINDIQRLVTTASAVATPLIIAGMGWWLQATISEQSIKKDYVQIATTILKDGSSSTDKDLRSWAVAILDKNSPVPFSPNLRTKLEDGAITINYVTPLPPPMFMEPPKELIPLPDKKEILLGDLMENFIDNMFICKENSLRLEHLQKLLRKLDESHKGVDEDSIPAK